jgi:hypothetical protein
MNFSGRGQWWANNLILISNSQIFHIFNIALSFQPGGHKNTSPGAIHSLFGAISVLLAIVQPISLLFKCPLQHQKRRWFNLVHRSAGIGCWIMGGNF